MAFFIIIIALTLIYIAFGTWSWGYLVKNNLVNSFPYTNAIMVKGKHFWFIYYILCGNPFLSSFVKGDKVCFYNSKNKQTYTLIPVFNDERV